MKQRSRLFARRLLRALLSPTALIGFFLFVQLVVSIALMAVLGLRFTLLFLVLILLSLLISIALFDRRIALCLRHVIKTNRLTV